MGKFKKEMKGFFTLKPYQPAEGNGKYAGHGRRRPRKLGNADAAEDAEDPDENDFQNPNVQAQPALVMPQDTQLVRYRSAPPGQNQSKRTVLVKQNGKMSSEKAPPMRIVTPESDSGRPSPPPKIKDSRMSMVIQGAQPHGSGSPDFSREGGNSSEVMERIFHQIHKAKIELPSINFKTEINRPFLLSDFEMALRDVLGSYEYLYRLWNDSKDTVAELEERYEALEAKYHDDLAQNSKAFEERILSMERESERKNIFLEGKMSNMKEEQETWKNKHDEWVARIQEDHKSEKDALIERYEIKIQKLNGVINLAKSKQDSEKKGLQQQHEDMMAKAKEELTRIKKDSESQVSRAQESLADTVKHCTLELETLRSQHRKEKQLIATDSDIERTRLFQELNDEKERWKREYQKERREMAAALDQAEDDLQKEREEKANEIRLLKSEHEAEKAEIKAAHGEDKAKYARGLQKTVENLQAALSNRDHFKAMSDHEFAYHFQDICTEVDEFARVSWEKEQASSWPFRDEMLRKSGNERRTKQYIIQNTLWVILYEKILCTPFRVLGSEGEVHQSKWIEKFGQARDALGAPALCPPPSKDSERWRYETMKTCVEAINQPPSEGDPNYRLKLEYESCLKDATNDISQELERVSSVSPGEKQRISDLVTKAAKLWLEVGQQRCRMFLLMSDSKEHPEPKISRMEALDHNGKLGLVVAPEVRRMGNAQGEQLDEIELVTECKGKFSVFSSR